MFVTSFGLDLDAQYLVEREFKFHIIKFILINQLIIFTNFKMFHHELNLSNKLRLFFFAKMILFTVCCCTKVSSILSWSRVFRWWVTSLTRYWSPCSRNDYKVLIDTLVSSHYVRWWLYDMIWLWCMTWRGGTVRCVEVPTVDIPPGDFPPHSVRGSGVRASASFQKKYPASWVECQFSNFLSGVIPRIYPGGRYLMNSFRPLQPADM